MSEPLKLTLFFSYGHPEEEICKEIVRALREKGCEVWFDESEIREGEDWRQRIIQGIEKSDGVISCLSCHSVRDPGVCLNELSIAIGIRGGNIKPILLEEEGDVRPPASLCHVQWLDMSDWRDKLAQGPKSKVFKSWFKEKMERLIEVVGSEENRAFSGQIDTLRKKLNVYYDTGKQRSLLIKPLVGRDWLTEKVLTWLDDPQGERLCVLYGDPGVGKSAFAAHYIHRNARVAAGLFCEYDKPTYSDPRTAIMTLAYLLACRLPDYRQSLCAWLEYEDRPGLDKMSAQDLFARLLAEPFSGLSIDGGRETLCVVIDGLDECALGDEKNALAQTLAQYAPQLPSWLRILVTAREVAAVTDYLGDAFSIELHADAAENQKDIRRYFEERLDKQRRDDPRWAETLDTLAERSGGIFLYAQLVCEGIVAGTLSPGEVAGLPKGLSGAFLRWFGWTFPNAEEYKTHFRAPLGVLLAAPEPIPTEELVLFFDDDENRLNDFLRRMKVLLRQDVDLFGRESVSFTHQYLSQWLDTEQAGPFRSSRKAACKEMARLFYERLRTGAETLTRYEAVHLPSLLEQAKMPAELREVMLSRDVLDHILAAAADYRAGYRMSAAMECYQRARAMMEKMLEQEETPDVRRKLSECCTSLANTLLDKPMVDGSSFEDINRAEMLELRRQALDNQERLGPGTPGERKDLSDSYFALAGALQDVGDLDGALERYQKSQEILEQLAAEVRVPALYTLLELRYSLGADGFRKKGDLRGALRMEEKLLAWMEAEQAAGEGPRAVCPDLKEWSDAFQSHVSFLLTVEQCRERVRQARLELERQSSAQTGSAPADGENPPT